MFCNQFKEVPHGEWVVINIPAEIDYEDNNFHNQYKNRRRKSKKHSDIVQFKQSYNIRGLTKGSSYKVSHFYLVWPHFCSFNRNILYAKN